MSTVSKKFQHGNIVFKKPYQTTNENGSGGDSVCYKLSQGIMWHCNLTPCWRDSWDPQPGDKLSPQGEGDGKTSVLSVLHRMENIGNENLIGLGRAVGGGMWLWVRGKHSLLFTHKLGL